MIDGRHVVDRRGPPRPARPARVAPAPGSRHRARRCRTRTPYRTAAPHADAGSHIRRRPRPRRPTAHRRRTGTPRGTAATISGIADRVTAYRGRTSTPRGGEAKAEPRTGASAPKVRERGPQATTHASAVPAACGDGGEGGIRTRDGLPRTAFPVRRHSPLGDLSERQTIAVRADWLMPRPPPYRVCHDLPPHGGPWEGGAEHRSERTRRCVSEEHRRQRTQGPSDGGTWRRGRDSNPRCFRTPLFESGTINHSDTSPRERIPNPARPTL